LIVGALHIHVNNIGYFFLLLDSDFCLKYSYHMYSNPGDLIVYAGERSATPSQVEIFSGNQGEQWHTSIVQIPQYSDTIVSKMS
jgi:hypothetical protein